VQKVFKKKSRAKALHYSQAFARERPFNIDFSNTARWAEQKITSKRHEVICHVATTFQSLKYKI
jgi:hypothetical protein